MLKRLIYRLTHRHHYWRTIGFDELSELYASMMLRSLAGSLVGIFIPIYLYTLGFTIQEILTFFTVLMTAWGLFALVNGLIVARIGPKHSMLLSYMIQIITMAQFAGMSYSWVALALAGLTMAFGHSMFFVAFHVDFSKVKHSDHGGKELGWLSIMEKGGNAIGPVAGGLIAYFIDPKYIFVVGGVILLMGAVPLFFTAEPTRTNQKISFKDLRMRSLWRDYVSYIAIDIEHSTHIVIWPLFAAVFILIDNPYIKLGSLASVSIIMAILVARFYGKVVDDHKGRALLKSGITANVFLFLIRPFVGSYSGVLAVNIAHEGVSAAYRMPYYKGFYDRCDDLPGRRIVYIASMEAFGVLGRALFYGLGVGLLYFVNDKTGLSILFVVASLVSLLVLLEKFKALDVKI